MRFRIFTWLCLSTLFLGQLWAGDELLTLDRIFKTGEFLTEHFGPLQWKGDRGDYTLLENSAHPEGGKDIVLYSPSGKKGKILVSASQLIPPGDSLPLKIENYHWSGDFKKLLIYTNSKRVWRRNTRGDYWVLDLEKNRLRQLGKKFPASSLMFAKFSPDGRSVAYVCQNNIYLENLKSGEVQAVTRDGSETIINGTFDWVYEEELDLRDGFKFSPEGEQILYWQLDASGVGEFYMINNTDSLYPKIIPVQYPKAGTQNSAVKLGVYRLDEKKTVWFQLDGDSRQYYLTRAIWAPDGKSVLFQRLNRRQNLLEVFRGNPKTGETELLFSETDEAWVDVVDDWSFFPDGKSILWMSERDGWRHLYRINLENKQISCLTPGEYDVIRYLRHNSKWIYFIASPDTATERYLYRVKIKQPGKPQRLSPEKGYHRYNISPDMRWAIHYYSKFGEPETIQLVSLPKHRVKRTLVENGKVKEKLALLKRGKHWFFSIPVNDSVSLDAVEMLPPDFDPQKKYPVLFYVYGEPANQTVLNRWGYTYYLWHLMLTQQGFIVYSVDNRGTPAPKGRDWRKCIYREVGVLASQDQAFAARAIANFPYVDAEKMAIWGWSGGGSMTLNMMFRYPDIFKVGMSVAPVADQRYYDTIYQERYMGLPGQNAAGYKAGSPIHHAAGLKGNLLIVHGSGDDNVHYQNTEALVNELIRLNKHFYMMEYPNRSHGIYEGPNTRRHLFGVLTRFLKDQLECGHGAKL